MKILVTYHERKGRFGGNLTWLPGKHIITYLAEEFLILLQTCFLQDRKKHSQYRQNCKIAAQETI
jgi:hypothetical protein